MTSTPDPWHDALGRWTEGGADGLTQPLDGLGGEPTPPAGRQITLTRPRIIGAIGVLVVLVGAAVAGGVLTYLNRDRADEWRTRSVVLQELVEERTKALNRQTARLNVASTTLRKAEAAISRSESDVKQLEARQRELANEKAQVEDAQAQLTLVADSLAQCNSGLAAFITEVNNGADPAATLDVDTIAATCTRADQAFQAFTRSTGQ